MANEGLDEDIAPAALVIHERRVEFHNDGALTDFAIVFRLRNDVIVAGGFATPQALAEHIAGLYTAPMLSVGLALPVTPVVKYETEEVVQEEPGSIQWFPESEVVE